MYAEFFGLRQDPFSIAPDPRYLFMSERHREALAHLLYGIRGGGGFVLLSGEIGAGKTTICRCFLEQTPENCRVAYIFNPKLTVVELLRQVVKEVGCAVIGATDDIAPLRQAMLAAQWPDGRPLFTPLVCLTLMIFYVFAMQCISTIAIVKRETNSWKWPLFQTAYMTGTAWILSFIVYQAGTALGF